MVHDVPTPTAGDVFAATKYLREALEKAFPGDEIQAADVLRATGVLEPLSDLQREEALRSARFEGNKLCYTLSVPPAVNKIKINTRV